MIRYIMFLALGICGLNAQLAAQPSTPNQPKKIDLTVEWGTLDSTILNNQTITWWVKYKNKSDTENIVIPKQFGSPTLTAPELWVQFDDSSFRLGKCTEGTNIYLPPRSSLFHICAFSIDNLLRNTNDRARSAKLLLKTGGDWRIENPSIDVRLLPPDDQALAAFFDRMQILKSTTPAGDEVRIPLPNSNYVRFGQKKRLEQCSSLLRHLDSISQRGSSRSAVFPTAQIRLIYDFCQTRDVREVGDASTPNWPWYKSLAKCTSDSYKKGAKLNADCQGSPARDFNRLVQKLAGLDHQIPTQHPPYKFLSGSDTVFVSTMSWFNNVSGVFR